MAGHCRRRRGRVGAADSRRSRQQRRARSRSPPRPAGTGVWLAGEDHALRQPYARRGRRRGRGASSISTATASSISSGSSAGRAVRLTGRGTRGYHYQVSSAARADGRPAISASTRSASAAKSKSDPGRFVQKQTITGPAVHVGLGTRTSVDVARIVWPNGVPQAEFDPAVDRPIVAEQRLKGSCPWVFADDGTGMQFVTDFLWRSPLGLRINAQDTAGVTQTEDWVKIRGDQLAARTALYDVRITAELWETHFVDHVSLLVVDHPDRRRRSSSTSGSRAQAPALAVHAMRHAAAGRASVGSGRHATSPTSCQPQRRPLSRARSSVARTRALPRITSSSSSSARTIRPRRAIWLVASRVRLSDRQQHQRGDRPGRTDPAAWPVARGAGCRRAAGSSWRRISGSPPARTRRFSSISAASPVPALARCTAFAASHESGDLLGLARRTPRP